MKSHLGMEPRDYVNEPEESPRAKEPDLKEYCLQKFKGRKPILSDEKYWEGG